MDLAPYSFLIAGLSYTALALYVLAAQHHPRDSGPTLHHWAFAGALSASALWAWAGLWHALAGAPFAGATAAAVDLLRYALWFALAARIVVPAERAARSPRHRRIVAAAGVLVAIGAARLLLDWAAAPAAAAAPRLLALPWLAMPIFGLLLVEQVFRNVSDDYRWNANPLCLGLGCVFVFDLYVFADALLFGRLDADSLAIRGIVHAVAVPLFFIAARRRSQLRRDLHISRDAAFHTATLFAAGVYLVVISALGYYVREFGGEWGRALQLGFVATALLLLATLLVSRTFRSRLRVFLAKNFFSYHYDYRAEWLRFTAALSGRSSPVELGGLIVRGLAGMVGSRAGMLWSRRLDEREFVQVAGWEAPTVAAREPADGSLCRFLAERAWIIDTDEFRDRRDLYTGVELPAWLSSNPRWWLVVPLLSEEELIAFVVLARPNDPITVNWEVRDLLKTAGRQAASYLGRVQAAEALLEARKFDAFNRMSAFVVHDLKNIVSQLSLMLSNAKRLQDNPEFRADMLQTVANSLDKMRQLILQLRDGEGGPGSPSGVPLEPIARRLQEAAREAGRELRLDIVEPVATRGHEDRVGRVLGHLVDNAFEATPQGGSVWLKLDRFGSHARVVVGDTGRGMSPEFVRDRLFRPFSSTKSSGMGIGAYESYQYVRELGGSIEVDTRLDAGTVVTVLLPALEQAREADLQLSGAK